MITEQRIEVHLIQVSGAEREQIAAAADTLFLLGRLAKQFGADAAAVDEQAHLLHTLGKSNQHTAYITVKADSPVVASGPVRNFL